MNDTYINKIKRWVYLDTKIELKRNNIKLLVDEKKELENDIIYYIEENSMQNYQINLINGYIKFPVTKSISSLSLKKLKSILEMFFQHNNKNITSSVLYKFIVEHRDSQQKTIIKRYFKI